MRPGCQLGQVLLRTDILAADRDLSLCLHVEKQELLSSLASSHKGTNPILEGATLMTSSTPKDPTSKYHHIGN